MQKLERLEALKNKLQKAHPASSLQEAHDLISNTLQDIENEAGIKDERMTVPAIDAKEATEYENGVSILLIGHRLYINNNGAFRIITLSSTSEPENIFSEKKSANGGEFKQLLSPKTPPKSG